MPFSCHHWYHFLGYQMVSGFAATVWLAAETMSKLLQLQPDEQLGAADVQLLTDPYWAHSAMNHADSLAAIGDAVHCRHFVSA